ncbi:uncharacterized protein LOC122267528 [Penaeus japonicus]|uniref:uncharacterized protein LOC122267528 n=1 Tax=Penaeus japonicus TaxID=27405 RepID=UPI001C70DE29|nr:uncharacterized protein LOC122267528 [Penaeus japonicus]
MFHPCILCKTCKGTNPEVVFHRFPRTRNRCRRWLNALQLDHIKDKTPQELNKSYRVCSIHFSPKNYFSKKHLSGIREDACPDKNLDPKKLSSFTAASDNTQLSRSISSPCLQSDSEDQGCSRSQEGNPSEIQGTRHVLRHPKSQNGSSPWRYQEVYGSSSAQICSAERRAVHSPAGTSSQTSEGEATSRSSSVASRTRLQNTKNTSRKQNHTEAHVGPYRFTDPISPVKSKMHYLALTNDSDTEESETEEIWCETVSQSTQTGSPTPSKNLDVSVLPSQENSDHVITKETKAMSLSAVDSKAGNLVQGQTTLHGKDSDATVGPLIPTTSGEDRGHAKLSYTSSPKPSQRDTNSSDETKYDNELTSEINNCFERIDIEEGSLEEVDEPGSIICSSGCECENCEQQKPSVRGRTQKTYSGPVRRQVVNTNEGGKRTYMILNKASLKTLQKKGVIEQVKKAAGQSQPSNRWSYATYSKTFMPSTQTPQNQEKENDESTSIVPDSVSTGSFQEQANIISTATVEQPNPMDSAIDPLEASDIQMPANFETSQNLETPHSSHMASVALGTPPPQGNQIPVVVTWSGTNATDTQSFAFTIKLSDQMDKCAIVQNTTGEGSESKQIVLKGPCLLPNTTDGSYNMNQQISSTTADQPEPYRYREGSYVDTGPSSGAGSKMQSRWNVDQTPIPCFPTEDTELSCDSPSAMDSSDPQEVSEGPRQNRIEGTLEGDHPAEIQQVVRHDQGGTENIPDTSKNVQWVALPTESVCKPYSPMQSPRRRSVYERSGRDLTVFYDTAKQRLKDRYKQLLNKHRQRYCKLLRKYKALEKRCQLSDYVGTREQIVKDAKKYLPEEHVLFLESQMFLRNRTGTGNRFSKKFLRFMMSLYDRSSAGYRFLRTLFTIPTIKTIQKWQSRPYDILDESQKDPLELIVDTREVDMMSGTMPSGISYEQENLAITCSMNAIQREFFPSTMHFTGEEEPEEGESSCEISVGNSDSEMSEIEDGDHDLDDEEEEEEEEEEQKEMEGNTELGYGEYTC